MSINLKKLPQQVVVITGATSGIGLVTARLAAEQGAGVVLVARTEESLRKLANELRERGARADYVVADVGDPQQVRNVADFAIERFGGFDTWINNAGVSIYGRIEDIPLRDQRKLFDTNYWGLVHGSLIAAEHLKTRGGAILNVGSALSDRAIPIQGVYCASKHAVRGFTEAFRMELEHDGAPISITLIKPSSIDTPYRQHAKNYMWSEPKNPAPVYAPATVAEAILYAAEHPVRDLFVGSAGKALSAAAALAPRLVDKFMDLGMFRAQRLDHPSASPHNGLDSPSGSLLERGGYPGHVAKTSFYTKAMIHPLIAGGLFVTGLGLAYLVKRTFSRNGSNRSAG